MSRFSASEAALEGFRITRENPRAFGVWVIASFLMSLLALVIDAFLPASVREGLNNLSASETLSPLQFLNTLILAAPVLILALCVLSVTAAAVYRLIFRHDDARFGYLRLGADEFRLMALTILCFGIVIGLTFFISVAVGLILALIAMVAPTLAQRLAFPAIVFSLGVVAYVCVRLSLAPVATFADRRLRIFESWDLTRGQFWPLLGAYVLAVFCVLLMGFLILAIFVGVVTAILVGTGGDISDIKAILNAKNLSLSSYLTIGILAYMIVNSVFSALWMAVIAAPGAVAYQQLHGTPAAPPLKAQPEPG